ncbi:MAG: hypothetical protein Q4C63_03470 [Eubacteriales bacterium]|nr:hypothetical protein [Eubacteriales bacterium]
MATTYSETPLNMSEIQPFIMTDISDIKKTFYTADRVIFYDACSFQRHAGLTVEDRSEIIEYYNRHGAIIFITRCILMELVSDKCRLAEAYIRFLKEMDDKGNRMVLFNEEYLKDILSDCYSGNETINKYLLWAVRMSKNPVSTIMKTLKTDTKLMSELIEGKNIRVSDLYDRFFSAVRNNKEHGDNLGEELIAICIHILSRLPGIEDGKLCVITDDKGAAGKIDSIMKKTNLQYRGARTILLSTPKLVQHIFQEHNDISEETIFNILSQGVSGNVIVMGTTPYDLEVNKSISMPTRELVYKIMKPNEINIVF